MEGLGFRDRIHEFTTLGAHVLGISPDTVATNRAFAERYTFPFPLLSDATRVVCAAYAACTGAMGEEVERVTYIIGPDGRIQHVIAGVNASEHPLAVLRVLYAARGLEPMVPVSLVYALGVLDYDFGTAACRDGLIRAMAPASPYEPYHLARYLNDYPQEIEHIIWVLSLEKTPLYVLRPVGSFASESYQEFWGFLNDQLVEGVERVSVPGVIRGQQSLLSGQRLPVVEPAAHGLYSWTTAALVESIYDSAAPAALVAATRNFLDRVYYQFRNPGQISRDRALNYAATNVFQASQAFQSALVQQMVLDRIAAEPSGVCRPDADCWDVQLTFIDPGQRLTRAAKVYRFTVDVSEVIPVPVGMVRSWDM